MEKITDIYLALGSNSGNREENILSAIKLIEETIGEIISVAQYFENEAQGFSSDTLFLNNCAHVRTKLSPELVLKSIQSIEKQIGRQPKTSHEYESRPIDIDIILFGDLLLSTQTLIIPHPHFRSRNFVLKPLLEIAPHAIDPKTRLSILQLFELSNF